MHGHKCLMSFFCCDQEPLPVTCRVNGCTGRSSQPLLIFGKRFLSLPIDDQVLLVLHRWRSTLSWMFLEDFWRSVYNSFSEHAGARWRSFTELHLCKAVKLDASGSVISIILRKFSSIMACMWCHIRPPSWCQNHAVNAVKSTLTRLSSLATLVSCL